MEQAFFWKEVYSCTKRYYRILFIISGEILTFILSLNYSVIIKYEQYASDSYQVSIGYALLASGLMFLIYWKLSYVKQVPHKTIKSISSVTGWVAFLLSVVVCYRLVLDTQKNFDHFIVSWQRLTPIINWEKRRDVAYNVVLPIICMMPFWAVFIFVLRTIIIIKDFFGELYKTADRSEKIYFLISLIECVSLICFFYQKTWAPWGSLDLVYQADTDFVYNHYYPVFSYGFDFDWDIGNGGIRHPLATLYTYPIYVIVIFFSNLLFSFHYIQPILYAIVQSLMMILVVIMLKRMINSKWIYLIFNLSFPFLFFSVFIEKYQMATFFIVMFAYTIVNNKKPEMQRYSLIAASGTMICSAWMGFFYGKEKKLTLRLKEYGELVEYFLAVLIGTGRIIYVINFPYLFNHNFQMFNGGKIFPNILNYMNLSGLFMIRLPEQSVVNFTSISLTNLIVEVPKLGGKICSFFNMIASCLVPIPYEVKAGYNSNIFFWKGVRTEINILGIVIFIIVVITIVRHRKEKVVQLFAMWILWGIIQFVMVGFSASCSPLFSLYFSWSVVPLLLICLKDVLRKPMQQFFGYGCIALIMICMNFTHLQQLYKFLLETAPLW